MGSIPNFVTCHCHPQSLDSASTPEAFIEREKELGTGAVTVTDHGTLVACRKVYDLARKEKLTPILGLEGYLRDDDCPILRAAGVPKRHYDSKTEAENYARYPNGTYREHIKYHHVTIHFLDQAAFETGVRLLSAADGRAEQHGSERKPIFSWSDLEELGGQNTTMTTGCLIGVVQRHLLEHDDLVTARAYYEKLRGIVRPGNFFVEVFPHKCDRDWVAGVFLELADGTTTKYHSKKLFRTNVGEVRAADLAKSWAGKSNEHRALTGVKDYFTWHDRSEVEIKSVKHVEDFVLNECRPWCLDGDVQKGCNRVMLALARQHGDKVMIGDDSHYALPEEKIVQDVRLCQNGTWRFYGSYHRQSSGEALTHFRETLGTSEAEFCRWVDNSREWADRFKDFKFETPVSIPTKFYEPNYCDHPWHKNPKIPVEDHSLMYTMELIKKHGRMDWKSAAYVQRLQAEIQLLHRNGVIDLLPYFFIGEEVCDVYERAGLLTGPGRGSAAGMLLTYLLGITHVDPIRYGLSMERFITLDRIRSFKLPDIDQDLPHRDLLVNEAGDGWLQTRFGDHYAQISVDTTLKLRMAVKDVARFRYGSVPPQVEAMTHKFLMPPQGLNDIDWALGYDDPATGHVRGTIEPGHENSDANLQEYAHRYPDDWEIVKKCLGLARSKGRHACAFVIANKPISSFIPLITVSEVKVTSFTAPSVEASGGLKMDFLVINSLNDLSDALKMIRERYSNDLPETMIVDRKLVPRHRMVPHHGRVFDVWDLPEDQDVFADVACGRTETVFQFNTDGALKWLRHFARKRPDGRYAIDSVRSMAAFTALDRPGPLDISVRPPGGGAPHNMLVEYARRAAGDAPSPDVLEVFNQLVPETYGVMCYQEQLQRVYQQLTGCTGTEAEQFRTNVSKKYKEKVDAAFPAFLENASRQIGESNARAAWTFIQTWAQYGFNLSHATCYAVIAYACAYLKHHFPLEWWCAVLRNASKNEVNATFWRYCGHWIDLPDVQRSGEQFEIRGDRIQAPLTLLKGLGEAAHRQLRAGRPYRDLEDFVRRQEDYRIANGKSVTKVEKKKVRVPDPAGGKKKVTQEVEQKVTVFRKATTALNRGVVSTLILSGAMDSLFPKTFTDDTGEHEVTVADQLRMFETTLAAVKTETNPVNAKGKRKQEKPEPVDPKFLGLSAIQRFQLRKDILPAYSLDLVPLMQGADWDRRDGRVFVQWDLPFGGLSELEVAGYEDLRRLGSVEMDAGNRLQVVVVAYVEDVRVFSYSAERKTACDLALDVEGGKFNFVKWPDKSGKPPKGFNDELKGAVVAVVLTKFRTEKPFSIDDVTVVQPSLRYTIERKEDT